MRSLINSKTKYTQQDFKIMRTFEEIVAEIIWQNENISKENADLALRIAFREFIIATADEMAKENADASNLFYKKSGEIFESMDEDPQV